MAGWTDALQILLNDNKSEIKIYATEVLLPYNHQTGKANVTKNSVTFHHFAKTWTKEDGVA